MPDFRYKSRNSHEVLDMTAEDAVRLSYIQLGQNATTLSSGEAQRVKLARELSKRDTSQTLYILDEPTTGLHFHDIEHLLKVLHALRDRGNTLVVIEHNLDVIKIADWIIDLGLEGSEEGPATALRPLNSRQRPPFRREMISSQG